MITGLRSLLDTYLYNHLKGNGLDRVYIEHELKTLQADQFERLSRVLGEKLFSDPDHCTVRWIDEKLTGEEQEMAEGLPRVRKVILYGRGFAESK